MTLLTFLFAASFSARAHVFIPEQTLCQTDDVRLLTESDQHTFHFKEPFARGTETGRIVAFEEADREAGETAAHVILVPDGQQFPTNYLRLTVPDNGFVRCLRLVPGLIRAGFIQSRESGSLKLIYVQAADKAK